MKRATPAIPPVVAGAALAALLAAGAALAAPGPAAPSEQPSDSLIRKRPGAPRWGAKFDHAAHRARKVAVDDCAACHGADPKGALAAPGRSGHQPCLSAGCHVDQFLAVGGATRKADPARYAAAAAFCQGCHRSASGGAPRRHEKARADNVYQGNSSPGHHVEMDHLAHAQISACRDCHVVDATSFQLVAGRPAHAECSACHGASASAPPMSGCATCHREPGPTAYFAGSRRNTDVRSCSPERPAGGEPCFLHERREHRFAGDKPIQCGSCHFMIADKSRWGGAKYRTLRDIAGAPIIHNQRDLAHKSCGESGCHQRDVDDSRGTARCALCHSKRVTESIFD